MNQNQTAKAVTGPLAMAIGLIVLLAPAPVSALAACDGVEIPAGSIGVEVETSLGGICIELLAQDAPKTVENFLDYLDRGEIDGTLFHRSIPGFIVQAGGFRVTDGAFEVVPPRTEAGGTQIVVPNERCSVDMMAGECIERGNERGTLALAKIGGDPNSGTTDWFVNLADNRASLDNQNGGFTVFGRVLGTGMTVIDAIAGLPLAGGDRVYWADPTAVIVFSDLGMLTLPPFDAVGASFGCFRHDDLAAVVDPANPFSLLPDPITAETVFAVAGACGSSVELADFVANPGSGSCLDADRLAANVTGPVSLGLPGGQAVYYSLTCAETEEAIVQRAAWRTDFTQRLHSELATVTTAVRVPEPSAGGLAAAAGLVLAVLRKRRGEARTNRV